MANCIAQYALVEPRLVLWMWRKKGKVEVGTNQRPGKDRSFIYDGIAADLVVTQEERRLTIGEVYPPLFLPGRRANVQNDAKRNAWDYTLQVVIQHLRKQKYAQPSEQRGVWELSEAGMQHGEELDARDRGLALPPLQG